MEPEQVQRELVELQGENRADFLLSSRREQPPRHRHARRERFFHDSRRARLRGIGSDRIALGDQAMLALDELADLELNADCPHCRTSALLRAALPEDGFRRSERSLSNTLEA